jgi:acyl-CoA synthetase (AMP-forming)/AMP-acid ligase II
MFLSHRLLPSLRHQTISRSFSSQFTLKSTYGSDLSFSSEKSIPSFVMSRFLDSNTRDRVAFFNGLTNKSITFRELYSRTYKFSKSLQEMGVKSGDCVAIISPNDIDYFTSFNGVAVLGAFSSPINPLYTESEILHQLEKTEAKVIISHDAFVEKIKTIALPRGIPVISIGSPGFKDPEVYSLDFLVSEQTQDVDESFFPPVHPDTVVTIPFSSGTTGLPKGVVLTHRNITSNILQCRFVDPYDGDGVYVSNNCSLSPLTSIPLDILYRSHFSISMVLSLAFSSQLFDASNVFSSPLLTSSRSWS